MIVRFRTGSMATTMVSLLALLVFPGSAAAAGALFVATSGSDSNPCTASSPCASISHAAAVASGNTTILVASGTYHDDVVINTRVNLQAQGTVVIDATGQDNGVLVNGAGATGTMVRGFTIENANFEGILVMRANDVHLLNNDVVHNDQGMFAASPSGECAPQGEVPGDCGEGIHLMTSTGSQVIHNTVRDNAGGILLTDEFGPTASNQIASNTVLHNQYDCGITLASHNPAAIANGHRQPNVAGVHDNLITGNVSNDNGNLGEGAGILIAAALPGGGAWSNRVVGNEANHNSMPGITIHSHTPNQDVNDNVLNGNRLSHDGLGGATGAPGDPDFGPIGTTGILVGSAAGPITGTQITGNHISNVHVGIWTAKVPPDPKLAVTNSFTAVDVPLHQQ